MATPTGSEMLPRSSPGPPKSQSDETHTQRNIPLPSNMRHKFKRVRRDDSPNFLRQSGSNAQSTASCDPVRSSSHTPVSMESGSNSGTRPGSPPATSRNRLPVKRSLSDVEILRPPASVSEKSQMASTEDCTQKASSRSENFSHRKSSTSSPRGSDQAVASVASASAHINTTETPAPQSDARTCPPKSATLDLSAHERSHSDSMRNSASDLVPWPGVWGEDPLRQNTSSASRPGLSSMSATTLPPSVAHSVSVAANITGPGLNVPSTEPLTAYDLANGSSTRETPKIGPEPTMTRQPQITSQTTPLDTSVKTKMRLFLGEFCSGCHPYLVTRNPSLRTLCYACSEEEKWRTESTPPQQQPNPELNSIQHEHDKSSPTAVAVPCATDVKARPHSEITPFNETRVSSEQSSGPPNTIPSVEMDDELPDTNITWTSSSLSANSLLSEISDEDGVATADESEREGDIPGHGSRNNVQGISRPSPSHADGSSACNECRERHKRCIHHGRSEIPPRKTGEFPTARMRKKSQRQSQLAPARDENDLGNSKRRPRNTYRRLIGMALCAAPGYRLQSSSVVRWVHHNIPNYDQRVADWAENLKSSMTLNASGRSGKPICRRVVISDKGEVQIADDGNWYELLPGMEHQLEHWDAAAQQPVKPSELGKSWPSSSKHAPYPGQPNEPHQQTESEFESEVISRSMRRKTNIKAHPPRDILDSNASSPDPPKGVEMVAENEGSLQNVPNQHTAANDESSDDAPLIRSRPTRRALKTAPTPMKGTFNSVTNGDAMEIENDRTNVTSEKTMATNQTQCAQHLTARPIAGQTQTAKSTDSAEVEGESKAIRIKSFFSRWPHFHPDNIIDDEAKQIEISQRLRRKDLIGKPAMYSRTGKMNIPQPRPVGVPSPVSAQTTSGHPIADDRGSSVAQNDGLTYAGLKDVLGLPDQLLPMISKDGELCFRDVKKNKDGSLVRGKTIIRTGY